MVRSVQQMEKPPIFVDGEVVVFDGFRESEPEFLRLIQDGDDVEGIAHEVLSIGARMLRSARLTVDAAFVEKQIDGSRAKLEEAVNRAVKQVTDVADGLLGENDGAIASALTAWKGDVTKNLEETFDPDNRKSAVAKFEKSMDAFGGRLLDSIRKSVSPDGDDSPLARLRFEIQRTVKEEIGTIQKTMSELSERVAVQRATAEVEEKTTRKGFAYEDLVHDAVSAIAELHGDVADRVGTQAGAVGSNVGDEVVTLNPEDTLGLEARYVMEVKDKAQSLRDILTELDEAKENREALAAIAVYARPQHTRIKVPFREFGDKAIVVYDKENPDDRALRLACMWARWVVRRKLNTKGDPIDVHRIESLIGDIRRALGRTSNVKKCHTTAQREIQRAGVEVDTLTAEIDVAIKALAEEVSK